MDKDQVKDIAKKGGEARAEQLRPEEYSNMGREGGASENDENDVEE